MLNYKSPDCADAVEACLIDGAHAATGEALAISIGRRELKGTPVGDCVIGFTRR